MTRVRSLAAPAALVAVATVVGLVSWDGLVPDFSLFARAGTALLTGRWSEVFADPTLQAGPVILVISAVLDRVGGEQTVAYAGLPVVVLAAHLLTGRLRAALGLPARPAVQLAAGAFVLLWESGAGAVHMGHLSQVLVPVLWVWATLAARDGRAGPAGALVALAAGCETWGVLAVPVLLLAGSPRRVATGAGAFVAGCLTLYLPFVLTGEFRMFEHRWPVVSESLYGMIWPAPAVSGPFADGFPWWGRVVQAMAVLAACTAVVLAARRSPQVIWLAPLAAVVVRLTLDPVGMKYYWTAAAVLLVAGAATAPLRSALLAVVLLEWQLLPWAQNWAGTGLVTLPGLLLLTALAASPAQPEVRPSGRRAPAPPARLPA